MFKTPENLNIISIDPSLRSTGVFMSRKGKCESYAIQKKSPRIETLGYFVRHFAQVAKQTKWDLCIVENYSLASRSSAVTIMAEIGGIIRACFAANDIPILEITPMTWKSIAGLNAWEKASGKKLKKLTTADRTLYREVCFDRFGFSMDTTDETDAFYMLWTAVACSRGSFKKGAGSSTRYALEELKIKS